MTRTRAVGLMVLAATLWSTAGVVTRQLQAPQPFEITFWRSAFNALALVLLLSWLRGPRVLARTLARPGPALWLSGACWTAMFTAFMLALTLTTVANVLVTMAIAPLLTALVARLALGHRLPVRTWSAIVLAGIGIAWMYGANLRAGESRHLWGIAVALAVPTAAAVNWTLTQRLRGTAGPAGDLMPAVLLGAVGSALLTLPLAWPLSAPAHDIRLLALLGVFQLAVPCLVAVAAARVLSAPEVSLLALLEVVFGVAWVWLARGEEPSWRVFGGGMLVLLALAANEWLGLRRSPMAVARPGA